MQASAERSPAGSLTRLTRMHSSRMHTACTLPYGGLHDRDLLDRDPQTETPPRTDPPTENLP